MHSHSSPVPSDHFWSTLLWVAVFMAIFALAVSVATSPKQRKVARQEPKETLPTAEHAASRDPRTSGVAGASLVALQAERRRTAIARIDAVRDDYGARLADPSYVIENHAIDDASFPDTAAFVDAYAAATAYDRDRLDADALEAVAGRLERTWRTCWQHAERLGLDALGEHKTAGNTALGLVRTALDPATPDTLLPELQRRINQLLLVCQITLPRTAQAAILPSDHPELPTT